MFDFFKSAPARRARPLILHVDDDQNLRQLVSDALKHLPVDLISAADGSTGVKLALKQLPDLILLDLMMPVVSGIEVCRELRKNTKTARIPIFMLTAVDQMRDAEEALASGANSYITKPFEIKHLLHVVSKQLFPDEKPSA